MTDEPASGAASPQEQGAAAWAAPDPDVVTQRLEDLKVAAMEASLAAKED